MHAIKINRAMGSPLTVTGFETEFDARAWASANVPMGSWEYVTPPTPPTLAELQELLAPAWSVLPCGHGSHARDCEFACWN